MSGKFTFDATARKIDLDGQKVVAAWTDGVMISSDEQWACAFMLKEGTRYKVTIELADEQ